MMSNILFVLTLSTFFAALFVWGFRRLPGESWQFIAAVPLVRRGDDSWRAVNLTFYGFFNASACLFSCAVVIFLMTSIGAPFASTLLIVAILLSICYPASKIVARLVEKKKHTFTIGGASFVGFLILPWLVQISNLFNVPVPLVPMLAAVAIAYAFGEALGRMACISFGCCYGKLIWHAPALVQKIFGGLCFVFRGETKKVAYESGLSGMPLVPIQAVTAVVSATSAIIGVWFFLNAQWSAAVLVPIGTTQVWRVLSETLRADYRGEGRISAYQIMAMIGLIYSIAILLFIEPGINVNPDVVVGLRVLVTAKAIVILEAIWLAVFLYLGRSSVTFAELSFHVVRERI
jgi:hypothetical protein